jgi:6-pyruvoyltetrahydropterin/6-carboxytetrahydropterin synthase
MWEPSKTFTFEAAHTLERAVDAQASRRIHGHSYRAEIAVRGTADPTTDMVTDLGLIENALIVARDGLDHHFLDEISDLGPATMENPAAWIWRRLAPLAPGLVRATVYRDSQGESCSYFGPEESEGSAAVPTRPATTAVFVDAPRMR